MQSKVYNNKRNIYDMFMLVYVLKYSTSKTQSICYFLLSWLSNKILYFFLFDDQTVFISWSKFFQIKE